MLFDESLDERHTLEGGSDLSADVAEVVGEGPRSNSSRVARGDVDEEVSDTGLVELTSLDDLEGLDRGSLIEDGLRVRRHRSGSGTTDIGVVSGREAGEGQIEFAKAR